MLVHAPRVVPGPPHARRGVDVAFWVLFAAAAVVFALDATATIHVLGVRPEAVEMNPIARWSMGSHPVAPYALKAVIVLICGAVAATLRAMGERGAAGAVVGLMALFGIIGIATGLRVLAA